MNNRKLQVFVSSTYTDLREERQAAVTAILKAGHIPAGMELFAANDRSQLETIYKWIDDSDVFMIIQGTRYGSIDQDSGCSYTELEYNYAAKKKKPLFAVIMEGAELERRRRASGLECTDGESSKKLMGFRESLETKTCAYFINADQLETRVMHSLAELSKNTDLRGWVRANDEAKTAELRAEIAKLKAQIAQRDDTARRNGSASGNEQESEEMRISWGLSDRAVELLLAAVNGNGWLVSRDLSDEFHVFGGEIQLNTDVTSRRERAFLREAIGELEAYDLIEGDESQTGAQYEVTALGFRVAEIVRHWPLTGRPERPAS